MPTISAELAAALLTLARMRHPAPPDLLRRRGYHYEAGILDEIGGRVIEELTNQTPETFTAEAERIADDAGKRNK